MSYLTESALSNSVDIPIGLPATELKQGDWLVLASVKVVSPMLLTYRFATINAISCTVSTSLIASSNQIFGNLGLLYLALRKDYSSGSPGSAGALDYFGISALGAYSRPLTPVVTITIPGVYSWIISNNMQPSTTNASVPTSTSIDFNVSVTGMARLAMSS